MKTYNLFLLLLLASIFACQNTAEPQDSKADPVVTQAPTQKQAPYAIVIHGGAGTLGRKDMTAEKDSTYRAALNAALDIGEQILADGGDAIDAVEQTIHYLENSPLFNAGRGAVFNHEGKNEMDASIMQGADKAAGAVGGVTNIKNPISAARAVMEHSPHVMLTNKGAETFAAEQGLELVDPTYFFTQERWDRLQQVLAEEAKVEDEKKGTVGCVALDNKGNIVAGTSTGGMTNKRWNRIGDSPIIGAGTYADNATCGVSCTGHGEYFIRWAVAHDVSARMKYGNSSLKAAADEVINKVLVDVNALGGLVALDHYGNIAMPFNTAGMYRGYAKPNERYVGIYKDE